MLINFVLEGPKITPLTAEGRVTIAILQMNDPDRLQERQQLMDSGRYP